MPEIVPAAVVHPDEKGGTAVGEPLWIAERMTMLKFGLGWRGVWW